MSVLAAITWSTTHIQQATAQTAPRPATDMEWDFYFELYAPQTHINATKNKKTITISEKNQVASYKILEQTPDTSYVTILKNPLGLINDKGQLTKHEVNGWSVITTNLSDSTYTSQINELNTYILSSISTAIKDQTIQYTPIYKNQTIPELYTFSVNTPNKLQGQVVQNNGSIGDIIFQMIRNDQQAKLNEQLFGK
jgi:hypothetical protein